jgi:hypothetical protein
MWFEDLVGFVEESPEQVRRQISVDGVELRSLVNGRQLICGEFSIPSLAELRSRALHTKRGHGATTVKEVVANVQHLHTDERNAGAMFQVGSQFNALEMVSPRVTPECGVGIYGNDPTQGPACAIAAGAGTIYRNYFVPVNGQIGQSASNQVDCLWDLGSALGNSNDRLWVMQNGYALATREGLMEISATLRTLSEARRDALRQLLRIGIQWETQVTLRDSVHTVSQAYCSALPVAYSDHPPVLWEEFAALVLEASYEAAFCASIINSAETGNNTVFLTLLGCGAFGNETAWSIRAIERALRLYEDWDLDVAIVSYNAPQECVKQLIGDA